MRPRVPLLLALVLPAAVLAQPLQVKATPSSLVLGRDTQVVLTVSRADGTPPLGVEAAASSGTLTREEPGDAAVVRFRYAPPALRHPLWATLVFWEPGSGSQPPRPTVLRLPLLGRTTLDIVTEPNAQVVVQVQRARFGPVRANAQGQVRIPVEVPPGVRSARVLATAHGEQSERELALDVPSDGALAALLGPSQVEAGGTAWLAVGAEEGLTPDALELTVEGGRAEAHARQPPLYRLRAAEGATRLAVRVRRRAGGEPVSLQAEVLPAPPPQPFAAPAAAPGRHSFFALGGAFLAGGANSGPALALGVRQALPALSARLSLEGELGFREARLEGPPGTGALAPARSRLRGAPLLLSLHLQLLERGRLSLGARLGGGVTLFRHRLQVEGQPDYAEGGVGPAGFAALQGGCRLGPVGLLLEGRASLQPATTPQLRARLGGLGLAVGVRYLP